ncbi:putative pectinesterase 11 [Morus notabilis]|uniref:putative pectinesterase 11 n=1 Tax=Morus notabilis TaxID=981085 RepID=UPI000CED385E|nr:putative pectinesterase 11 [Morus notabilis]
MAFSGNNYSFAEVIFFFVLALSACGTAVSLSVTNSTTKSSAVLLRVDQSGKGDYKKIQDAIDAVPANNKELVFILVKPGIYKEKVFVPADKPFITLSGTKASETVITWSESGDIFESPTMTVLASDFVGRHLTIQNTYGSGGKAVALWVSADRAAFYGCRIISYQDTLLDDTGRHYYKSCYIQGGTDFICGNAASLFEKCHIHSLAEGTGAITAQRRESPSEDTGFTFLGCTITGTRTAMLGRPWGDYSRVVFALSYMSNVILPQGWEDWGDSSKQSTVFYGQYKCYGPGAVTSKRVKWARNLTAQEAEPFLTKDWIDAKDWIRPVPTTFTRTFNAVSNNVGGHN